MPVRLLRNKRNAMAQATTRTIAEKDFESWGDFVKNFVLYDAPGWIFRGHRAYTWKLESKLARVLRHECGPHKTQRENYALSMFQRLSGPHLSSPPHEDD